MTEPLKFSTSGNGINASSIDRDSILKAVKEAAARFDKAKGPDMSRAYLVVPPDFLNSMKMEPLTLEHSTRNDQRDAFRYSLMGFGMSPSIYGMPVIINPYATVRGDSPEPKRVVWKDRPAVEPIPLWQYFVLVSALVMILLLAFAAI